MKLETEIAWAKQDAERKLADVPRREQELFADAIKDGRKPFDLTPHTAVKASTVMAIIDRIKSVPQDLAGVVKAQKHACEQAGGMEVALLSADVLALIKAGEASAKVSG